MEAVGAVGSSPWFTGVLLDDSPALLDASFRLRYQVYCLERQFLPAQYFPAELETDVFDQHSVHLGVLNAEGDVVATTRLVRRSEYGLPMDGHCILHAHEKAVHMASPPLVEISRLSVSRRYNRRKGDDHYSLGGLYSHPDGGERRQSAEIVLTLYRTVYQASRRYGFTHWLAATERSLQRLMSRYEFPFRQVGPETDYFGPVAPYLLEVAELDALILGGRVPLLRDFLVGLEPEFHPQLTDPPHSSAPVSEAEVARGA